MKKVLFNSWPQIYAAVFIALLVEIILFYAITKAYN